MKVWHCLACVVGALAASTCSAPPAARPAPVPAALARAVSFAPYAAAQPEPDERPPTFCHLGTDCMQLESRPFSLCLVSGEPCRGEGRFLQVAPADEIRLVVTGPLPTAPRKK